MPPPRLWLSGDDHLQMFPEDVSAGQTLLDVAHINVADLLGSGAALRDVAVTLHIGTDGQVAPPVPPTAPGAGSKGA